MTENDVCKYIRASKTNRREQSPPSEYTRRAQRCRLPSKQSGGFRAARLKTGSEALDSEVGEGCVGDRGGERSGVQCSSVSLWVWRSIPGAL